MNVNMTRDELNFLIEAAKNYIKTCGWALTYLPSTDSPYCDKYKDSLESAILQGKDLIQRFNSGHI